jgi:hypothetical protein
LFGFVHCVLACRKTVSHLRDQRSQVRQNIPFILCIFLRFKPCVHVARYLPMSWRKNLDFAHPYVRNLEIKQSTVVHENRSTLCAGRFSYSTLARKSGHIPIKLIIKSLIRPAGSLFSYIVANELSRISRQAVLRLSSDIGMIFHPPS